MTNVQRRDLMRRKGKDHVRDPSSKDWHISDDEMEDSGSQAVDIYIVPKSAAVITEGKYSSITIVNMLKLWCR
jgi:hypothetical protein